MTDFASCGDRGSLLHAVEVHRQPEELDGEPELAVCGAVVAVTAMTWASSAAPAGRPACPDCAVRVSR